METTHPNTGNLGTMGAPERLNQTKRRIVRTARSIVSPKARTRRWIA